MHTICLALEVKLGDDTLELKRNDVNLFHLPRIYPEENALTMTAEINIQ